MQGPKLLQLAIAVLAIGSFGSAHAQTFSTIYTFDGTTGKYPSASLVQGRDGNLYGTTTEGGTFGLGTVFRERPDGSQFQTLYNFSGTDGSSPSGLTLAGDGNFYGTAQGGFSNYGVLFRINSAGILAVLYNFTGGTDGKSPLNSLIEATDGNLYGANLTGIYRYAPSGTVQVIYPFPSSSPIGQISQLMQETDGMLYVVNSKGGVFDCGSISKLTLQGVLKTERDFGSPGVCWPYQKSGWYPYSPVIQASDGNIYGTNVTAGVSGSGTAFRLDAKTGILTVLHSFNLFDLQGDIVYAGLVQGNDGNLYGVTASGGAFPFAGVIYQLKLDGTYTFLVSIADNQEDWPNWSLIQHTNGKFYSVNLDGGANKDGTVYSFDNGLGPFVTFVRAQGKIGSTAQVLGQGFTGTTSVTFNGIPAAVFTVVKDTYLTAVVPSGVTTGPVVVTTPGGILTSNKNFTISH